MCSFKKYFYTFEWIIHLYNSKFKGNKGYIIKINLAFTWYCQSQYLPRGNHIKCMYCLLPFLSWIVSTNSCHYLRSVLYFLLLYLEDHVKSINVANCLTSQYRWSHFSPPVDWEDWDSCFTSMLLTPRTEFTLHSHSIYFIKLKFKKETCVLLFK